MVRQRVCIRFCKRGDLRWIGHRDLMRCLERLFRRAGLALRMSEGFHPKPRMTFPSALPLGIEGLDEVMELELAESQLAEQLRARLAARALPGLEMRSVEVLPPGAKKARLRSTSYRMPIPAGRRKDACEKIDRLLAADCFPISRLNRPAPLDLRRSVEQLTLREGVLSMRLRETQGASVRAREVLAALELAELEREGVVLSRYGVEVCR